MAEREDTAVAPRKRHIRTKVERIESLPTLHGVVRALREVIAESGASMDDVGDLISKDLALSANLLKLVNSPFYGFPARIASVHHAVMLAGSNVVKAVASGTAICEAPGELLVGLWEHSLGVALVSRLLAVRLGVQDADEIMVAGLLHDLGKALLHAVSGEELEQAYRLASERNMPILEAERQVFGADHEEIGGWIAASWNFPPVLEDPISCHHKPSSSKKASASTAIIHFADILVRSLDFGCTGDTLVPPVDEEAWNTLGFSLGEMREIVDQVDEELDVTAITVFRSA